MKQSCAIQSSFETRLPLFPLLCCGLNMYWDVQYDRKSFFREERINTSYNQRTFIKCSERPTQLEQGWVPTKHYCFPRFLLRFTISQVRTLSHSVPTHSIGGTLILYLYCNPWWKCTVPKRVSYRTVLLSRKRWRTCDRKEHTVILP